MAMLYSACTGTNSDRVPSWFWCARGVLDESETRMPGYLRTSNRDLIFTTSIQFLETTMATSTPPTYHLHPPSDVASNALAPSSLPWFIGTPLSLLSTAVYIAFLPAYLAYQTAIYYTFGPPWHGWSLGTMLFTRGLRLLLQFMFRFGLPRADRNAWKVPIGARQKGVDVECRRIAGIPKEEENELRIGWARQESVKVSDVPGFMLWPETRKNGYMNGNANKAQPSAVTGSGYALANDGEKIVYYLVGGGYISGHPLRTHLAWTTCRQLNVRVFGTFFFSSLCGSAHR